MSTPPPWQPPPSPGWQQPPASPYGPQGYVNPYDAETTPILVTGILSLVLCGPIGIYAWIKGNQLRDRANAAGWPEPGTAKVGRILGIVGTVIGVLQVGGLVLWIVAVVALGTASTVPA